MLSPLQQEKLLRCWGNPLLRLGWKISIPSTREYAKGNGKGFYDSEKF